MCALLIFSPVAKSESQPMQPQNTKFLKDSGVRMAFNPWGLFADRVAYTNYSGSKSQGIAPGIMLSYLAPWEIGQGKPGTFDGGGYVKFIVGFGKIKTTGNVNAQGTKSSKNWIPYDFSLGPYGSYISKNGHHEFGFDYGMVGIYGYSSFAYFGSQFTAKYRYRFLQVDLTRGGTGVFTGCIVPKFESAATHSAALSILFPKGILAGLRYTSVPSGGAKNGFMVNEWRLFCGFNLSSI